VSAVDIGILAVVGLALVTGWWRGLFRPLIAWAFVLAGVVIGFGHPALLARWAPSPAWDRYMGILTVVAATLVGAVVARLLGGVLHRRIPLLGTVDRLGGALVSGGLSLVAVFVLLSAAVAAGGGAPTGFLGAVRAQMARSRLAPLIFGVGQRIPFLGDGQSWPGGG
jgi:uncharacterized membrane protein required for colicin V production